jgi:hypothetical protein
MKVKVSRRLLTSLVAIVVVSIILIFLVVYYIDSLPKPIYRWNYYGVPIEFRVDLRKAEKVPVYPGETQVFLDTIHPLVDNVTIAFKDAGEDENPYYILEEIEIITKMTLSYTRMWAAYEGSTEDDIPKFDATPVDEYANLPGKIQNPIIAIVHPKYANETAVRNEGHVTYISGTTHENLDLATVKFLMIALGIEELPE